MKSSWRTTVCGVIAALGLAGFAGLGLPEPWPRVLALACAAALAALGYNATDCQRCPGLPAKLAAGAVVLVLSCLACGCAVQGLGFGLSSPTFGSLQVTVGGGAMGNAYATNALGGPCCPRTAPGTNCPP